MNKYVFAYYGEPNFNSPEEGKKHMSQWGAWMKTHGYENVILSLYGLQRKIGR